MRLGVWASPGYRYAIAPLPFHYRSPHRRGSRAPERLACVRAQAANDSLAHLDGVVLGRKIVDGADVVQATTGNPSASLREGAGHHPRRPQGDGVHLVGTVGVPDNKLAILRCTHQLFAVFTGAVAPVHGVDLCEVPLEHTPVLDVELFDLHPRHILELRLTQTSLGSCHLVFELIHGLQPVPLLSAANKSAAACGHRSTAGQ